MKGPSVSALDRFLATRNRPDLPAEESCTRGSPERGEMKIELKQLARRIGAIIFPDRSQRRATKEPARVASPTALFAEGRKIPSVSIDAITTPSFPRVDFKFHNGGEGEVVLRQISLKIESVELNPTPSLTFDCIVRPQTFKLFVKNRGWGPAESLQVEMSEPLLDELFSAEQRSGSTRVDSAGQAEVLELALASASPAWMGRVDEIIEQRRNTLAILPDRMKRADRSILDGPRFSRNFCNLERLHVERFFDELARGDDVSSPRQRRQIDFVVSLSATAAPVNDIDIRATLEDVRGCPLDPHEGIVFNNYPSSPHGQIWLTRSGFNFQFYPPPAVAPQIGVDVMARIEPAAGPAERIYPLSPSFTIPAGGVERFALAVGADHSCDVRARLACHFDGSDPITSPPFELKITFPVNGNFHAREGTHFVRTDKGWQLADQEGRIHRTFAAAPFWKAVPRVPPPRRVQ